MISNTSLIKKPIDIYLLEVYETNYSGYNTFRDELIRGLSCLEMFVVHIIVENCPIASVRKFTKEGIYYIHFPEIKIHKFEILESFFREAIYPSSKMVFLSNFFPAIFNITTIKRVFPHSKIIHIVHDLPWLTVFKGDVEKYIDFFYDKADFILSPQQEKFVRYCTYDIIESFKFIHKVICLCEDTYNFFNRIYGIPLDKLYIIPNGLEDQFSTLSEQSKFEIKNEYGLPHNTTLLLMVGRLTYSKGIDRIGTLIDFFNETFESWKIIYIGNDDIKKYIPSRVLDSVISLGFMPHTEIYKIYSVVDFGLLLSRHEQCSYVGIEMLMFGVPAITTLSYGVRNMFNHENAIIFSEVSNNFKSLIYSENIRVKARKLYLQNYTYKHMINCYTNFIKNIW